MMLELMATKSKLDHYLIVNLCPNYVRKYVQPLMFCDCQLYVLISMESPNYAYILESDRDVVDGTEIQNGNLRSIQSASSFRRTSPQRNSIRRNAWMRSSLRKGPVG